MSSSTPAASSAYCDLFCSSISTAQTVPSYLIAAHSIVNVKLIIAALSSPDIFWAFFVELSRLQVMQHQSRLAQSATDP